MAIGTRGVGIVGGRWGSTDQPTNQPPQMFDDSCVDVAIFVGGGVGAGNNDQSPSNMRCLVFGPVCVLS
eukprot:12938400-Alexandrium_andersonii.AAC.1